MNLGVDVRRNQIRVETLAALCHVDERFAALSYHAHHVQMIGVLQRDRRRREGPQTPGKRALRKRTIETAGQGSPPLQE